MTDAMRVSLSDSNSLLMNTDSLESGSNNQVKFNVTKTSSGLSATFEHLLTVNKNPDACKCDILPSTGVAMTTLFTFNCPSCQNAEKSYKFEYGFIDNYSGAYITLSKDEELYQKLPAPYFGSELELYVKVTDSLTGAFTTSTRKVTISLPVAKTVVEIQKLVKSWNQVASLLAIGDYRRSVFNAATISRTSTMMLRAISYKRSICSGNGQLGAYGKCICNQGYVSSDCKFTIEQFETTQSLCSDLLNDLINSNQIKLQSGEVTNREYLTSMLFGFDSILQNYEFFNSQLFNSSLTVLKQSVDAIESTSLSFTSGEIVYLKGILNSLYKFVSQSSNEKNTDLIYQSRKLGGLIMRSILIGQSPIKFETSYHLNLLNKHFKSELNSMILESENTNITLPSTISQSISTKSIKTPVTYDWFILKDSSSFTQLPQQADSVVSIVSVVNELQLNPSPSSLIQDSKILYYVRLNNFKSEATYSCAHMSNYETITTAKDCSIKIENQIAKCECSQIYNIAILQYLPNTVVIPQNPSSGRLSDFYWFLWGFFIAIFVVICLIVLVIIGVVMVCCKRQKKKANNSNSYPSATHGSLSVEMKQV